MLKKLNSSQINQISFFLIILQSIGIRFFSGFGILMIFLILVLNIENLKKIKIRCPDKILVLTVIIIILFVLKGITIKVLIYILLTLLASILFLINYNNIRSNFIRDIKPVLWFFAIYGFVTWSLLCLIPGIFVRINLGLNYDTFIYLLYNSGAKIGPIPRLSSLLWEPGCCQFILNLLLIILITRKEKLRKIVFVTFLVLITGSTTGYINLIFISILYAYVNKIKVYKLLIGSIFIFGIGLYSIVADNITDKVANSSGIIRTRDLYVGYELSKRHPIIGVDTENLDINPEAQILEDEIWGAPEIWTKYQGYFAGGYTNGLMGVFMDYGLIIALLLYYLTLKAPIIWNNKGQINPYCFFAVYFCSLIGEPISRTSMFFIFALSYLVNKKIHPSYSQVNSISEVSNY